MGYLMTASIVLVAFLFFYLAQLLRSATKVIKQQTDYIHFLERTIQKMKKDKNDTD
jgi:uncharacterized protein YoxC